jgi:hypothetical protein
VSHLCQTCKLAEWDKTANGRRHPNGQGKCGWTVPYIPTPAAFKWGFYGDRTQPMAYGGRIEWRYPVEKCEIYEAQPEKWQRADAGP